MSFECIPLTQRLRFSCETFRHSGSRNILKFELGSHEKGIQYRGAGATLLVVSPANECVVMTIGKLMRGGAMKAVYILRSAFGAPPEEDEICTGA